ncbi:hypothetical protein ACIBQ1_42405 [Nonomuraea sp. NPDC050153]|uniref:hypothetical protein n=1 Tax=Nonomuraea sp. NPDC050153 TaxID=3364359 RepID=UPI0037A90AC7
MTTGDRAGRVAPIQQRRWLRGVRPEHARPLFGRAAWIVYGAAAAFSLAVLALVPALRPDPAHDAFAVSDVGLGALLFYPITPAPAVVQAWRPAARPTPATCGRGCGSGGCGRRGCSWWGPWR